MDWQLQQISQIKKTINRSPPNKMIQNILTTFSIVSIKYQQNQQEFYLTSISFIRDNVCLTTSKSAKDFENSLFYVETDSNQNQIKSAIEFGQKIVFRHKISNKYLSHSDDFEEEENDTTYKLKLSHKKHHFKILPCFQYQTKISSKIRFNQDVYLVTQINGAKTGYLSSKKSETPEIRQTILGINQHNTIATSKFSFHRYYEQEKDEQCYTFGSIVWISHIESTTFMSCKSIRNKKELAFESIQYEKDLQSIAGLWLIQSVKFSEGGKIMFESKFRLKNLSTGSYMSFSGNFKMNENQRVYSIILEDVPTDKCQFVFRSLKGDDNVIKKNSYLILRHYESKLYIGCRKNNFFPETQTLKPISYSQFSDEDLFKIIELGENEDQALRFVLSLRKQLDEIDTQMAKEGQNIQIFEEHYEIFLNIRKELEKLKSFEKLFQKVQGEIGQYIESLSQLLTKYRGKLKRDGSNFEKIVPIMKTIYEILITICCQNRKNQQQLNGQLANFVEDIFLNLGAENLLIEIFKNNYKVLYRASKPIPNFKNKNIIEITFQMIQKFAKQKNNQYWKKLLKVIEFLFVLINDGESSIDINQRIVSQQFFSPGRKMFTKIFFGIKISSQRIRIEQEPQRYVQIERIRNDSLMRVIEEVFKLFSMLAFHRNFISKKFIDQFLSQGPNNNIEAIIAYFGPTMPISEKLCNSLYLLITNLYIDSSPRIDREKPLSVVNFSLVSSPRSMQEEENIMTDKIKSTLLNKLQQSYQSRPLMISNLLLMGAKLSMEPTISHSELALYKQEINEKLRQQTCSVDLLKTIRVMIRLESYTEAQLIDIFKTLKKRLKSSALNPESVKGIMQILLEISAFTREAEMKKMTAYLKYKYRMKQLTINYDRQYEYLLPFSKKILPSPHNPHDINESIASYNNLVDTLDEVWPCLDLKKILLSLFISQSNQNNLEYLQQIYNCLVVEAFHKKLFMESILKSIVVTNEESATFDALFQLYKKLKHLTAISEYWLIGSCENKENMKSFVKYMIQITNYLHQNYEGNNEYSAREIKIQNDYTREIVKEQQIYVNRQLLLRNIGFHKLVLELLQSNYFLLQMDSSKKNADFVKTQQIFSICFEFLYGFIYNCMENKDIVHGAWNILDKFQNLPEVGQTRVYRQLYKNKIEYIREIKKTFIERIINKILKNPRQKSNDGCQFNPEYLRYLESIVKINGTCHKLNLEKFYRLIEKESSFKKILYGNEQADGKIELCLDMFQIKTDCVQVPYIYHIKILGLICDMADFLDSQSTIIKSKLRSVFNFNYLIRILSLPDIYSHTGLQAKMRFLLKRQIKRVVMYFLERNDCINILHQNLEVVNLLEFYYSVFVHRPKKIKEEFMNQALYLPYFTEYQEQIQYYENNERKYFHQRIVPFLQTISNVLRKAEKSTINVKITQILQDYDDKKMVQYFQFRKMGNKIDKVSLRWLNFVDRDENNSPEQKFAKLSIVDLLRSSVAKKVLQSQNQQFYKLISNDTVKFIDVLIRLISMNMEEEYKQNESQTNFDRIHSQLILLRKILMTLPTKEKKQEQIIFLMERGIVQNFIGFTIKSQFDFSKTVIRKIYHQIIKIFVFILSNSSDSKPFKQMYKFLNENQLCFRFWSHLSESILTISQDTKIQNPLEQVNWSLNSIYLTGQTIQENIYEEELTFLEKLCEYGPFTKFLRYQPLYPTKDFLQILYHILNFVLIKPDKSLNIKVSTVQASQKVINCMLALMLGRNQGNQNYIVDSKFPQIVTEVLKIEKLKTNNNQADLAERGRLIDEVIEFYEKNGIDLSGDLRHQVAVLDFNHPYVLNRLKYCLLRTLFQSIAGNERSINKLKFQIPIQLIKINLIWTYQEFKSSQLEYNDELVLKYLHAWDQIVDVKDLNGTFIMNGFYLYFFIQIFGEESETKNQDEDNSAEDKEKRKQKIVNKFFRTISQKDKKKEKLLKLQKQPFAEEMKLFFESYYEALDFFKSKSLSIEVNFHDELTKVYFPKLPICQKMNNQFFEQFKIDAVRISQEQKIKSLIEFQQESFDRFSGEQKFFKKVSQYLPKCFTKVNIITEERLRVVALITCFIQTILFFVENTQVPNFVFTQTLITVPATELQFIMAIIGNFNLLMAVYMFFNLIFKKSPIAYEVASDREKARDDKERKKMFHGRNLYIIKNSVPQLLSTFIYIALLFLSFVHPFFGAFILFDIMNRMKLGQQIFRSVKETWFQLLMATLLLILFNYLFALYIYIQFSRPYYSPACEILFQCLLLLVDQSLKSGSGFYGTTPQMVSGYVGLQFDLGFFSQMIYIIFAQKVMFQIFSGTIIDKFSQLREQAEAVQEDEKTFCYICGQERFTIDFQLQGFETHVQHTHNTLNYIFYLYYLRKQNIKNYGIVDRYVNDCQNKKKKYWIPNDTSIFKEQKQRLKVKQGQEDQQFKLRQYLDKKAKDIKQIRTKNAQIVAELKMESTKSKA